MATESADGSELAVTLPPPLEEWLDERAATLDTDREELLVQLVSTYRAAADLDDETVSVPDEPELDERISTAVESHIEASATPENEDIEELSSRIDSLETEIEADIEDVRDRVLQVRDAVKERAPKDHTHAETRQLAERVDGLAGNLEDVGTEVTATTETVEELEARLSDVESKLDRLARVVVALRNRDTAEATEREEQLDHIRRQANEQDVVKARCATCEGSVRISLLTEPACPHCGAEVRDIEPPNSVLGRALDIGRAKLTGPDPPALEAGDE
jgi:chromosome segregation ATPase